MILAGDAKQGLQSHQQEAYEAVNKAFESENKAAVVMPTGCGKSFIALQLMEDNKDKRMLFLAPTHAIQNQMYEYIAKYIVNETPTEEKSAKTIAKEHFKNLKIILYPTLLRMGNERLEKLNPDIIIMDELHRTGAEKWGEKVNTLLELNPDSKVLGLTATPDRTDDKNVVDELFSGNIDYELTLIDAIRNRIVKAPSYVKCDYALEDELENVKELIDSCDDEKIKLELQLKYDKMRKIVDNALGIPELFEQNMTKKDGKYIVFCKDKEHLDEVIEKSKNWFKNIDENFEIYSVYSKFGIKSNQETIKQFEESKTEHLKVLYSIEMLNEGLHVEDISGVIMLRPTESRILYLQQLGRALLSDTTKEKTIVFDLVNNYIKNNLDKEINIHREIESTQKSRIVKNDAQEDDIDYDNEDIDIFRIQGETKKFLELLEEVREISIRSIYLKNAIAIKKWMEERKTIKTPSASSKDKEERRLGQALQNIKKIILKPYEKLETEEARKEYKRKHPEYEEIKQIMDEMCIPKNLRKIREIKRWMEERGITKTPSSGSEDKEERRLGEKLRNIKQELLEPYEILETEEAREEYKREHPEYEEVKQIFNEIYIPTYLKNAIEIKRWMEERGTTKTPSSSSKDKEEYRLGQNLQNIKKKLLKPYEKLKTEEARKEYKRKHPEYEKVKQIMDEICTKYLKNAIEIKRWMEERGTTKTPSSASEDKEERRLGVALNNIKRELLEPYEILETEDAREKYKREHPEYEEVKQIFDEIYIPNYLKNAIAIKKWMEERETAKPPSQYTNDKEEYRLGNALSNIKRKLLKPYEKLETEEARKEYKRKHSEYEKVKQIVDEIEQNRNNKLEKLVEEDIAKREMLEKAKALEAGYEEQLKHKTKSKDVGDTDDK